MQQTSPVWKWLWNEDGKNLPPSEYEGDIVSFDNPGYTYPKDITIGIEPVQSGSGDPSPTNVRPISGWTGANVTRTGKNLLKNTAISDTKNGLIFTVNPDGSVIVSGTATVTTYFQINGNVFLKAGPYTLSGTPANVPTGWNGCIIYDDYAFGGWNDLEGAGVTKTIDSDTTGKIYLRVNGGTTLNDAVFYPMIEAGTIKTTYTPYITGTTYPISWQAEAGTVYGGTLDVTTGLLTVDRAMVDLGTLNYSEYGSSDTVTQYYTANLDRLAKDYSRIVSDVFVNSAILAPWTGRITTPNGKTYLRTPKDQYSSPANFKAAMSGVQLVYELATPQTYQLSPTDVALLLGVNNVWAYTGKTSVVLESPGYIHLETRATIGDTVVTEITQPVITRALMQDRLSVGNVVSASLAQAVRGAASIPRSASVVVEVRLNDGQTASEWLPQGTFYISRRMRDPVTGLLALECYDALLKANAVWTPLAGAWPRTMAAVVAELAALLGVTLDSRTVIPSGAVYVMAEPAEGTTIRDALSVVAQAAGGNWIMTPGNRLRLVRVGESGDAVDVTGVVGGIDVGQAGTVTGVRSTVDGVVSLVGDDTGIVVDVAIAPMIAADMAEALIGQAYTPFQLSGAIYDPAAELGDGVRAGAGGEVVSALCSEEAAYGPAFRGDIAAPDPGEVTDEYPYIGSAERTLALAKAAVTEAVDRLDDELTQQEIFNRLTDNGAAQGLVLYNGQLYINASYIQSGSLNVGFIDFNAPVNDFDVPDENNPDTLLEGQAVVNGWIVNTTGLPQICALNCAYAKLLRGRTITLTFTFNGTLTKCESISQTYGGDVVRTYIEPEHATNPYTYQFTVPDNSDKFGLYMYCDGLKQISATVSGPQIVYPDDIKFSYAGLQIGHFMVDRSGIVQTKRRINVEGGVDYPETRRVGITPQVISVEDLDSEDGFTCNIARNRIMIGKQSSSTASQVPTITLSDSGPGDSVSIRSDRGIEIIARVDGSLRTVAYLRGNGLYTAGYLSAGDAATTRANLGVLAATGMLTPSAAFSIPSAGNSVRYNMTGITTDHVLTHWNFSSSPENAPPVDLTWTTDDGYFTITNNGGTTAETIKPVFELPTTVSITRA